MNCHNCNGTNISKIGSGKYECEDCASIFSKSVTSGNPKSLSDNLDKNSSVHRHKTDYRIGEETFSQSYASNDSDKDGVNTQQSGKAIFNPTHGGVYHDPKSIVAVCNNHRHFKKGKRIDGYLTKEDAKRCVFIWCGIFRCPIDTFMLKGQPYCKFHFCIMCLFYFFEYILKKAIKPLSVFVLNQTINLLNLLGKSSIKLLKTIIYK